MICAYREKEVGRMSRFLRVCALLSVLFFTGNVFAAYSTCDGTAVYTSCNAGYYLNRNGAGNDCVLCSSASNTTSSSVAITGGTRTTTCNGKYTGGPSNNTTVGSSKCTGCSSQTYSCSCNSGYTVQNQGTASCSCVASSSGGDDDGGYTCPTTQRYESCKPGYYMTYNGVYNGVPQYGNECTVCPTGCSCAGGTANKVCASGCEKCSGICAIVKLSPCESYLNVNNSINTPVWSSLYTEADGSCLTESAKETIAESLGMQWNEDDRLVFGYCVEGPTVAVPSFTNALQTLKKYFETGTVIKGYSYIVGYKEGGGTGLGESQCVNARPEGYDSNVGPLWDSCDTDDYEWLVNRFVDATIFPQWGRCDRGYYLNPATGRCTECPVEFNDNESGLQIGLESCYNEGYGGGAYVAETVVQEIDRFWCPEGTYRNEDDECVRPALVRCPAGTYLSINAIETYFNSGNPLPEGDSDNYKKIYPTDNIPACLSCMDVMASDPDLGTVATWSDIGASQCQPCLNPAYQTENVGGIQTYKSGMPKIAGLESVVASNFDYLCVNTEYASVACSESFCADDIGDCSDYEVEIFNPDTGAVERVSDAYYQGQSSNYCSYTVDGVPARGGTLDNVRWEYSPDDDMYQGWYVRLNDTETENAVCDAGYGVNSWDGEDFMDGVIGDVVIGDGDYPKSLTEFANATICTSCSHWGESEGGSGASCSACAKGKYSSNGESCDLTCPLRPNAAYANPFGENSKGMVCPFTYDDMVFPGGRVNGSMSCYYDSGTAMYQCDDVALDNFVCDDNYYNAQKDRIHFSADDSYVRCDESGCCRAFYPYSSSGECEDSGLVWDDQKEECYHGGKCLIISRAYCEDAEYCEEPIILHNVADLKCEPYELGQYADGGAYLTASQFACPTSNSNNASFQGDITWIRQSVMGSEKCAHTYGDMDYADTGVGISYSGLKCALVGGNYKRNGVPYYYTCTADDVLCQGGYWNGDKYNKVDVDHEYGEEEYRCDDGEWLPNGRMCEYEDYMGGGCEYYQCDELWDSSVGKYMHDGQEITDCYDWCGSNWQECWDGVDICKDSEVVKIMENYWGEYEYYCGDYWDEDEGKYMYNGEEVTECTEDCQDYWDGDKHNCDYYFTPKDENRPGWIIYGLDGVQCTTPTSLGHYSPEDSFSNYTCSQDNYQDETAQASCKSCSDLAGGFYPDTDDLGSESASACYTTKCGPGTYIASAHADSCSNVGEGNWIAGSQKVYYGSVQTPNQCTNGETTIGYGVGADDVGDCGRIMHVGNDKLYLRSTKLTTPSLNVLRDGKTYYANMSPVFDLKVSNGAAQSFRAAYADKSYWIYDQSAQPVLDYNVSSKLYNSVSYSDEYGTWSVTPYDTTVANAGFPSISGIAAYDSQTYSSGSEGMLGSSVRDGFEPNNTKNSSWVSIWCKADNGNGEWVLAYYDTYCSGTNCGAASACRNYLTSYYSNASYKKAMLGTLGYIVQ